MFDFQPFQHLGTLNSNIKRFRAKTMLTLRMAISTKGKVDERRPHGGENLFLWSAKVPLLFVAVVLAISNSLAFADVKKINLVPVLQLLLPIESVEVRRETIIDNRDKETSFTGEWSISGGENPFGSDSLYGSDGATFNWFFTPPVSGYYEVSMWWTDWPSRSNTVPVDIENANGSLRVVVNQKLRGGTWNILEPLYFEAGREYKITITGQPSPTTTCADAVKFSLVETPPKKMVAMGDSITFGEGDDDSTDDISQDLRTKGGGFEPILNNLLTIETGDNYNIVNEGRGGTTSADGLALIQSLLARHPGAQKFLVQYGTNDARPWLPIPSGKSLNPGDDNYPGSFKDNMQRIIDAINISDIEVCLAKAPITLGDGYNSIRYVDPNLGARSLLVKEYNEVIDELVEDDKNKIKIVPPDFYNLFNSVDPETGTKLYENQYADNLHPNGEGYRSMAKVWRDSLIR